jgi:hypothetical protein
MRIKLVISFLEDLELPYDDYCVNYIVKEWERDHKEEIIESDEFEIDEIDVESYWMYYVKENLFV